MISKVAAMLKSFCYDIQGGAMVAILKIFSYLLPKGKSDWAETWWKASGQLGDWELLKSFVLISKMVAILKFSNHICFWMVSLSWKLVALLKSFCSDIQNGCHGGLRGGGDKNDRLSTSASTQCFSFQRCEKWPSVCIGIHTMVFKGVHSFLIT